MLSKPELLRHGIERLAAFCTLNGLKPPSVHAIPAEEWRFQACAFYRQQKIYICLPRCAAASNGGRSWSWPGYKVDRTPYGVVQHELGHHVDMQFSVAKAAYNGDYSRKLRASTGEAPISGYCPDDGEWFAEIFRVFVTNPDLLSRLRPVTYKQLCDVLEPFETRDWRKVLANAPERVIRACENQVRGR